MIITIILGLLFSKIGFGEVIENKISQKFPFYFGIHRQNLIKWNNPEQGLLIGKIIKQDDNFILKTFENYEWKLIYEDYYKDILDKIDKNEFVRIIGSSEDENFYVCEILLQGEQPEFRRRDMAERKNNFMRSIGCEEILPYKRLFKNRITN